MIPACPFVHRVLLACHVRQISNQQIERVEIDLANPPSNMLKINPTGSVPTLEFEAGEGFHESMVIMEFLDSLEAKGPKIFGNIPRQIAQTKVLWEAANNTLLTALQQGIYSNGNTNNLNSAASRLNAAWAWLNENLTRHGVRFFGGSELNAIDIAIAPFLVRLKYASEIHQTNSVARRADSSSSICGRHHRTLSSGRNLSRRISYARNHASIFQAASSFHRSPKRQQVFVGRSTPNRKRCWSSIVVMVCGFVIHRAFVCRQNSISRHTPRQSKN